MLTYDDLDVLLHQDAAWDALAPMPEHEATYLAGRDRYYRGEPCCPDFQDWLSLLWDVGRNRQQA